MTSPEGAPVVAIVVGYIGPVAEGELLVAPVRKFGSPLADTIGLGFFHVHGAASRVDRNETAFGLRDDQWDYDIISQWLDRGESARHIQWTREFWTAVEPFATGEVYVNHLDAEETTRIRAAWKRWIGLRHLLWQYYLPASGVKDRKIAETDQADDWFDPSLSYRNAPRLASSPGTAP
jgi:hypothetical protein